MQRLLALSVLLFALSGCGFQLAASPTPTPTEAPPTARATAARPSPTAVHVDPGYASFVRGLCSALSSRNGSTVGSDLMDYQYNSGLRWGMLGDGEGHTSDPSLLNTWLAQAGPKCTAYSAGTAGHGVVMAVGWSQPGPASLIELDTISGTWKINDFTFGSRATLAQRMQIARPVLRYRG
jgi:hypothetical protein